MRDERCGLAALPAVLDVDNEDDVSEAANDGLSVGEKALSLEARVSAQSRQRLGKERRVQIQLEGPAVMTATRHNVGRIALVVDRVHLQPEAHQLLRLLSRQAEADT